MQNLNLIRSVAWSFAKKTGVEFDELFSEAALAYCEAVNSWDKEKSKLTTYAYKCMRNRLINFCKYETRHTKVISYYEELPEVVLEEELYSLFNLNELEWSEECRGIAEIILEDPGKFLGETQHFRRSGGKKTRLKKELRRQGWLFKEIQMAFDEMKQQLQIG